MNDKKRPWTHEEFLAHERKLVDAQKQERDTHFAGFAKLMWEEASNTPMNEIEQLIARRAYDLVVHALNTCSLEAFEIMVNGAQEVPDLTEWPKSEQVQLANNAQPWTSSANYAAGIP